MIRTCDILLPKQALYQTELRPETSGIISGNFSKCKFYVISAAWRGRFDCYKSLAKEIKVCIMSRAEKWQSGRMRATRNRVYGQPYQGFESLLLRQNKNSPQGVFYFGKLG